MKNGNFDTEKYKQELMKLYSRSSSHDEELPKVLNENTEELPDDTAYAEFAESDGNGDDEDYNSRYPEPDLSELDTDLGTDNNEDDEGKGILSRHADRQVHRRCGQFRAVT